MNLSDYEILGFNLGGLFMVAPLIIIFVFLLLSIKPKEKNHERNK